MNESLLPEIWQIDRVMRENADTATLALAPLQPSSDYAFSPGQFNMLYVFGVGEVPISLSGDPTSAILTHTVRAVGAVSSALARMKRGASVGVRGPFGSGWPVEGAVGGDVIIIAGGIGLAPLRPAIYALGARRAEYGRIALFYGARTPRDLIYAKEIERWRRRFEMDVRVTVDSASAQWRGHVGVVTKLLSDETFRQPVTAMVCGPEIMMHFTIRELEKRGLADEQIYISMERNMKCAVGFCGHCQYGPYFICKEGPVFRYDRLARWFAVREV